MKDSTICKIANYIIYLLITILILLIFYNIAIIVTNFKDSSAPHNSIKVSPNYELNEKDIETTQKKEE